MIHHVSKPQCDQLLAASLAVGLFMVQLVYYVFYSCITELLFLMCVKLVVIRFLLLS